MIIKRQKSLVPKLKDKGTYKFHSTTSDNNRAHTVPETVDRVVVEMISNKLILMKHIQDIGAINTDSEIRRKVAILVENDTYRNTKMDLIECLNRYEYAKSSDIVKSLKKIMTSTIVVNLIVLVLWVTSCISKPEFMKGTGVIQLYIFCLLAMSCIVSIGLGYICVVSRKTSEKAGDIRRYLLHSTVKRISQILDSMD